MPEPVILLNSVSRRFGRRYALEDIDLHLDGGRLLGLVGPNGSGKTTLLKLMAGFIKVTEGKVRLFGYNPYLRRPEVMGRARFAFAPPPLYDTLTAWEHLKFLSSIGRRRADRSKRSEINAVLELVGLAQRAGEKVRTFSFGMRQRLGLAQALLPMPELLIFDEPTDGLDAVAVLELRNVLKNLQAEHDITIVLASHLLIEVEKLADSILVLNHGKSLYFGSPGDLLDVERRIVIKVAERFNDGLEAFRTRGINPQIDGNHRLILPAGSINLDEAVRLLKIKGLRLIEFHEKRPTLEDALLQRLRAIKGAENPSVI